MEESSTMHLLGFDFVIHRKKQLTRSRARERREREARVDSRKR